MFQVHMLWTGYTHAIRIEHKIMKLLSRKGQILRLWKLIQNKTATFCLKIKYLKQ